MIVTTWGNSNYPRAIFNWVSKVILDCFGFALLCSVIGPENLCHNLNQSNTKLKPISIRSLAFSRASSRLPVLLWVLIGYLVLFGGCGYFGVRFSYLSGKLLYFHPNVILLFSPAFHQISLTIRRKPIYTLG